MVRNNSNTQFTTIVPTTASLPKMQRQGRQCKMFVRGRPCRNRGVRMPEMLCSKHMVTSRSTYDPEMYPASTCTPVPQNMTVHMPQTKETQTLSSENPFPTLVTLESETVTLPSWLREYNFPPVQTAAPLPIMQFQLPKGFRSVQQMSSSIGLTVASPIRKPLLPKIASPFDDRVSVASDFLPELEHELQLTESDQPVVINEMHAISSIQPTALEIQHAITETESSNTSVDSNEEIIRLLDMKCTILSARVLEYELTELQTSYMDRVNETLKTFPYYFNVSSLDAFREDNRSYQNSMTQLVCLLSEMNELVRQKRVQLLDLYDILRKIDSPDKWEGKYNEHLERLDDEVTV